MRKYLLKNVKHLYNFVLSPKDKAVLLKPQRKRDAKLEVLNSHIPDGKTSAKRLNTLPKVKHRRI